MSGPFDPAEGRKRKREGMDRAERHADDAWWQAMLECGRETALRKPYFITDDLERLRLRKFHNCTTHEHRALGPLMRELQRLGYCEPTQDWVKSEQKCNHRRPMMVWHSLLYRGSKYRKPRRRIINDPRQYDLWGAQAAMVAAE